MLKRRISHEKTLVLCKRDSPHAPARCPFPAVLNPSRAKPNVSSLEPKPNPKPQSQNRAKTETAGPDRLLAQLGRLRGSAVQRSAQAAASLEVGVVPYHHCYCYCCCD